MDSPEGRLVAGTPLSKVEDSPVFNFLNNLSPIKPVKSVHSIHAYTSPGFSSISSVFSSPHINQQRESRFLIRHSYPESSKQDDHAEDGIGSNLCAGVPDCVGLSTSAVLAHESCTVKCSLNEATLDPPEECLALTSRLPGSAQYGCSSPDHNITPCYGVKLDPKFDLGCPEDKRKSLFSDEFAPAKNLGELTKEEVSGSDWENIVYTDADDLLLFDDSTEAGVCEGQDEKLGEKDAASLASFSSKLINNVADRSQKRQTDAYFGPCLDSIEYDPPTMHHKDVGEKDDTDHIQHVFSGACQDQVEVSNLCREGGDGADDCLSFNSMIDSQQQRGIRRRCLVFDASGVSRRNSQNASNSHSSDFMQSSSEFTCSDTPLASVKPGTIPSPCVLPGIGLHLNTLASNSRDRMTQEALSSERGLTGRPFPIDSFPPILSRQNSLNRSLAVERDQDPICNESQNSQIVLHDGFLGTELGSCEELSQSSPKKKKRKPDSGEGEGCKRCNCKKSKCLKLYCECFAAGVYCIESCSCQECFNKPIHEETVLATRKQIETRNPLAFAPKVIRTSETFQDMREETNTTPASARHKRGCNCKKSSCLKKYCECFQGGVGCSLSCRCEGCKNAFGRKDGVFPMGTEEIEPPDEEINACGKEEDKLDDGQANGVVQKDAVHVPESVLLTTPRPISRSSAKQSSRKPPRSTKVPIEFSPMWDASQMLRKSEITFPRGEIEKHVNSISEDTTPEILRGNASPNNCVKTASPNSKRVSPPHIGVRLSPSCKGGRKMILKSIPSFPSLNSDVTDECQVNQSSTLP